MRYRVQRVARGPRKGQFVCVIYEGGRRRRIALEAANKWQATAEVGQLIDDIKRKQPRQTLTVGEIVEQYLEQSEAIWKDVDRHHWKAAAPTFGGLGVGQVTDDICRSYAATRKAKPGTIRKELGVVRSGLSWARKRRLIEAVPALWLPPAPPPKDRRLTRDEAASLQAACDGMPHLRLFVALALGTAARSGAILGLRWQAVDLERGRISYADQAAHRQKGRATVPINSTLGPILKEAHTAALTPFVIEWAGGPVKSIKRAFRAAVTRAGLSSDVTPHVLRHTAASWMAEAGVSMDEIAQFLGHSSPSITYKVYARFSPDYLQKAAKALG